MRRALFLAVMLGVVFCAFSALANNVVGVWLARGGGEEWLLHMNADGTFSRRVTTANQVHNEQGRYQVQGQQLYVQVQGEAQGYYIQFQLTDPNTLELYEDGQLLAQLKRMDNQGNLAGGQRNMQPGMPGGGMQPRGGQPGMQGGMQGGGGTPPQSNDNTQAENAVRQAFALHKQKQYGQAIVICDQVIAGHPNFAPAYNLRGRAYLSKGELAQAVQDFNRALNLDPNANTVYYYRSVAYMFLNQFDPAMADAEEYIRRKPDDPDGPRLRNEILKRKAGGGQQVDSGGQAGGSSDQADEARLQAFSLVGKAIKAWNQGQHEQAMQLYDQAVATSPHYSLALSCRARALLDLGQFDKAVADTTLIMQTNPSHNGAYLTRAIAYFKLGRLDEALADVNEYIRREPTEKDGPELRDQILTRKQGQRTGSR